MLGLQSYVEWERGSNHCCRVISLEIRASQINGSAFCLHMHHTR